MLVDAASGERDDIAGWPSWSGSIEGNDVVLAQAGLGKVNAAALTALLWQRHRPELVMFSGVAGGLDPSLGVGDIVIGERTIQHDAGVLAGDGLQRYQAGHVPFFNPTDEFGFAPSQTVLDRARAVVAGHRLAPVLDRVPSVVFGTILTGDQFLQDPATRDELFDALGAQAIEMEGAAVAQVAARLEVDHLVIRALSDVASDEAATDFDRFVAEVSANSARLVTALIGEL